MLRSLIRFWALAALAPVAAAQPGVLDPTFGDGGLVTTNLGRTSYHEGTDTAIQPDGKMVVAGLAYSSYTSAFVVVRFNSDGSLDPSFGSDGVVVTPVRREWTYEAFAEAVVIQPDGRIIAAGEIDNGRFFVLVRYLPDGQLDASFGEGGIVLTEFGSSAVGGYAGARDVLLQPDGRIVVGGHDAGDFAIVRYTSEGVLDPSFSSDGVEHVDFGESSDYLGAMALDASGRIVAAGYTSAGANADFALVRLTPSGQLDSTFGSSGKVQTDLGRSDRALALALQPDGAIVVGGYVVSSGYDLALARYLSNGVLDPSFGRRGYEVYSFGYDHELAYDLAIQPDGKIVAGGYGRIDNPLNLSFLLMRVDRDGLLDPSFGEGGVVFGLGDIEESYAHALVVLSDGRIFAAGWADDAIDAIAAARYLPDGTLDPSFDGDGVALVGSIGPGADVARGLVMQPDRKLVVSGSVEGRGCVLIRYDADGARDLSFGNGGIGSTQGCELARLDDGRLLTGSTTSNGRFAIARFSPDGDPDSTFGEQGIASLLIGGTPYLREILPLRDGRIVLIGSVSRPGYTNAITVGRLWQEGLPDPTFGSNGVVLTTIAPSGASAWAGVELSDGRLVVGGSSECQQGRWCFTLVRYLTDGALDPSFGSGGIVRAALNQNAYIRALVVQADDRVIAAGSYSGRFLFARYLLDGSLDLSFDGDGRALVDVGPEEDWPEEMVLQPDGKVVAAGRSYTGYDENIAVVRLSSSGQLDPSFGIGGKAVAPFGPEDRGAAGVVVQPSGRIVVAGTAGDGFQSDFALAGYLPNSTIAIEPEAPEAVYGLSAGYPNPSSSTVRFTVEVPYTQRVRVAVYDLLGREVAVLHEGPVVAGAANPVVLDGRGLSSGLYLVRASGESFTASRRVSLVRE